MKMKIQAPHLPKSAETGIKLYGDEPNQNLHFIKQSFEDEDFTHLVLDSVLFTQCTFENIDFSYADFMYCK